MAEQINMDLLTSDPKGNGVDTAEATETDAFLMKNNSSNGGMMDFDCETGDQTKRKNKNCSFKKVKEQLNEKIIGKVRLWMVITLLFVVIILLIIISLATCAALHKDEDDQFDHSLFTIPHYINGSFQMSNFSSTSSLQVSVLQEKLADLYRDSPALGRYFSKAEINGFRNDSIVIKYNLTFVLPEEQQEELRNFTLSREMVYNVFRQFLYDQDPVEVGVMHIDPDSLQMFSVN